MVQDGYRCCTGQYRRSLPGVRKGILFQRRLAGENLWQQLVDHRKTTRGMAVAMLRITLTGGFIALGLSLIFPNEFSLAIVRYAMGIFGVSMMILTAF